MTASWFDREWHHLRHHETSAAHAAATATIRTDPPEDHMSTWLDELRAVAHNVVDKIEAADEAAIGVVEAIKVNPTAVSITNTLASVAHLPDPQGLLSVADGLLKSLAAALQAGAAATAEPSFTPAGPQVAGQA